MRRIPSEPVIGQDHAASGLIEVEVPEWWEVTAAGFSTAAAENSGLHRLVDSNEN